ADRYRSSLLSVSLAGACLEAESVQPSLAVQSAHFRLALEPGSRGHRNLDVERFAPPAPPGVIPPSLWRLDGQPTVGVLDAGPLSSRGGTSSPDLAMDRMGSLCRHQTALSSCPVSLPAARSMALMNRSRS